MQENNHDYYRVNNGLFISTAAAEVALVALSPLRCLRHDKTVVSDRYVCAWLGQSE